MKRRSFLKLLSLPAVLTAPVLHAKQSLELPASLPKDDAITANHLEEARLTLKEWMVSTKRKQLFEMMNKSEYLIK